MNKIVSRDWQLVAKGTRMTKEFATFLKAVHRYHSGKKSLGKYFHINGKLLEEQYATHLSDYRHWDQLEHAEDYVVFPENIGAYITIDETSVSQGELYTVITNKAAKGNKGSLIAIPWGHDQRNRQ